VAPRGLTPPDATLTLRSMAVSLRALARRVLGVQRTPTYYLPWLTLNGLECALILNNVEVRFKPGENQGPYPATVVQHDADGGIVRTSQVSVTDTADALELSMTPTPRAELEWLFTLSMPAGSSVSH